MTLQGFQRLETEFKVSKFISDTDPFASARCSQNFAQQLQMTIKYALLRVAGVSMTQKPETDNVQSAFVCLSAL